MVKELKRGEIWLVKIESKLQSWFIFGKVGNYMPTSLKTLSRVELALERLGLVNKSCEYVKAATGMEVLHTDDPGFNSWINRLEKFPVKPPRYNKRKLSETKKDKALQSRIYYEAHKKKIRNLSIGGIADEKKRCN